MLSHSAHDGQDSHSWSDFEECDVGFNICKQFKMALNLQINHLNLNVNLLFIPIFFTDSTIEGGAVYRTTLSFLFFKGGNKKGPLNIFLRTRRD